MPECPSNSHERRINCGHPIDQTILKMHQAFGLNSDAAISAKVVNLPA
jgi:hypothetical protein